MEFPVVKLADRLTYIILNYNGSMAETYVHSHTYRTRTAVAKVVCYIDIKRYIRLRLCCSEWVKSNDHRNYCFIINSFLLFVFFRRSFLFVFVLKHIYLSTCLFCAVFQPRFIYSLGYLIDISIFTFHTFSLFCLVALSVT